MTEVENGGNYGGDYPTPWTPGAGTPYDEWEDTVKLWSEITNVPIEKQAGRTILRLGGQARKVALRVPRDHIRSAGDPPRGRLLAALRSKYGKDAQIKIIDEVLELFALRKESKESMAEWITPRPMASATPGS